MSTAGSQEGPEDRIASTLFGRTRRRVLTLLYQQPDEPRYVREIVRATGVALGAVQRELRELAEAGVLKRTTRGQQVFYQPDRESPVYMELASIVAKTSGLVNALRKALEPLRKHIRVAFIFGSMARGDGRSTSDVDLFVIGSVSFARLVMAVADVPVLGREINPIVLTPEEFRRRLAARDHFVTTVLRTRPWFVMGDQDELDRLGVEPMADETRNQSPRGRRSARSRGPKPGRQRRPRA